MFLANLQQIPVLAVDFGSIVAALFVLFSIVGFISNMIKSLSGAEEKPQVRRRPQRHEGELQNEIDDFLKEVLGGNQPQRPKPRPRPERLDPNEVSVSIEEPPPQPKPKPRPRPQPQRRRPPVQKRQPPKRQEAVSPVFDEDSPSQPIKNRQMESSIKSHVHEFMKSQFDAPQKPIQTRDVEVIEDVKTPPLEVDVSDEISSTAAQELLELLSSPAGMRQIIIANELLSKPRSLR